MQKIDFSKKMAALQQDVYTERIAPNRFQDELPKIIAEFDIKHPQDKRLWRMAKDHYGWIESKVAYIREQRASDYARGKGKPIKEYTGLLLWMIFKKHQGN